MQTTESETAQLALESLDSEASLYAAQHPRARFRIQCPLIGRNVLTWQQHPARQHAVRNTTATPLTPSDLGHAVGLTASDRVREIKTPFHAHLAARRCSLSAQVSRRTWQRTACVSGIPRWTSQRDEETDRVQRIAGKRCAAGAAVACGESGIEIRGGRPRDGELASSPDSSGWCREIPRQAPWGTTYPPRTSAQEMPGSRMRADKLKTAAPVNVSIRT
ncbi:hypothetical protein JHW43_001206 [Diplocarpon mali]|nr:hypothetical protein JHW43_001206 [Diplocarpon mali]